VLPATQDPLPVHPMPPHCENLGKLPPEAGVVVAGFVAVDRVVGAGVVGATGLVVVGGGIPPTGATEVTGGVLTTPPKKSSQLMTIYSIARNVIGNQTLTTANTFNTGRESSWGSRHSLDQGLCSGVHRWAWDGVGG